MQDIKISLKDLSSDKINIPLGKIETFIPIYQSDLIENKLLPKREADLVENVLDFEKINYIPNNSFSRINVSLYKANGNELFYSDLGYSNDDVLYQRKRFTNSFLLFDFFNSSSPTNQKRLFQISIYNQLGVSQMDINGNLLDVSIMPVTFEITNPKKRMGGAYEGYYLFWYKNPPYDTFPKSVYAALSYYNAVDGNIMPLISYGNPIQLNEYIQYRHVRYVLNKNQSNYTYVIDFSNRDLTINSGVLNFNLHQPNFI